MSIKINDNEIKKVYLMKAGTNEFIKQNLYVNDNEVFRSSGWGSLLESPFYSTSGIGNVYSAQDDNFVYVANRTLFSKYNKTSKTWETLPITVNGSCTGLIMYKGSLYFSVDYPDGKIYKFDLLQNIQTAVYAPTTTGAINTLSIGKGYSTNTEFKFGSSSVEWVTLGNPPASQIYYLYNNYEVNLSTKKVTLKDKVENENVVVGNTYYISNGGGSTNPIIKIIVTKAPYVVEGNPNELVVIGNVSYGNFVDIYQDEDDIIYYQTNSNQYIYTLNLNTNKSIGTYSYYDSSKNYNRKCSTILQSNEKLYTNGDSNVLIIFDKKTKTKTIKTNVNYKMIDDEENVYTNWNAITAYSKTSGSKTGANTIAGTLQCLDSNVLYLSNQNKIVTVDKNTLEKVSESDESPFTSNIVKLIKVDEELYAFSSYGEFAKFNL